MGSSLPGDTDTEINRSAALFAGAMPKGIGAPEFLKEHPDYDGRGVVIAILDTGVDPGAAGLQTTTDGKPKILDILDCTGSGDVDTSTIVLADSAGIIKGHFDTPLKVNAEWKNPSGEWHVGFKRAYDLFASGLQNRITQERKKRLEVHQREAVTEATRQLAAATAHQKSSEKMTEEDKRSFQDKEEQLKLLNDFMEKHKDPGPMVHAVVWHDGDKWLTALDTSELYEGEAGKGLLADHQPLADFAIDRQYSTFSAEDACNYGVHVYEEGNLLSIVVECGSHGTHVAGIAAAHHPDEPHLNGIAPGAQIISCKIGDSRLEGMETNVGLTRGLIDVLRHKADLINLSYGEAAATPNAGRFVELANEVVNKHGVIFISSAGNSGPALSSVGAPGGTSSSIISIGAFVSPELAAAGHSVREALAQGQQYTWSSRGPTADGDIGVNVSGPGGAIAPVPQWTQQSRQLMNGTSMASPCVCGGFALILSGLKATGQMISPNRVRRGVQNTCQPLGDDSAGPLTYGRGLLQVQKAFELLTRSESADYPDVRYEVKVRQSDTSVSRRGVYLREPSETSNATSHVVDIIPRLREVADTKEECLKVEDKLLLKSTAPWVSCPEVLLLPFKGRNFQIKVDPRQLQTGVHYAEVIGIDSTKQWRGPLFRVPITVVKPLFLEPTGGAVNGTVAVSSPSGGDSASTYAANLGVLSFTPGKELRHFIAVPAGANWAELRIQSGNYEVQTTYMVRAAQLLPHTRYSDTEAKQTATLPPSTDMAMAFKTVPNSTVEVTIAQFWSSLGASSLDVKVDFYGIEGPEAVHVDGSAGISKFFIRAPFRHQKVAPVAKLNAVCIPLRPAEALLAPMAGDRDRLPDNRTIHMLELIYKLEVEEPGAHKPTLPMLNRFVYDSVVEAEMTMVYDSNKKLLGVGDIYPKETTLQKGSHVIKLLLRHDDPQLLEKLRDMPLVVERKLKDAIQVDVYQTNSDAVKGCHPVKDFVLSAGEKRAVFIGTLAEDKIPKDATFGRKLSGKLQLGKLSQLANGKDAPVSIPLSYSVAPKKDTKKNGSTSGKGEASKDAAKPLSEQLSEKIRDAKIKFLEELKNSAAPGSDLRERDQIGQAVLEEYPNHLPALLWRLRTAEEAWALAAKEGTPERDSKPVSHVVSAADSILAAIDQTALAKFLALKNPEEGPDAEKTKKEMEEQKAQMISALNAKAKVLLEIEFQEFLSGSSATIEADSEGVKAFKELRKWVDTTESDYATQHAKREALAGRVASAIRVLEKLISSEKAPEKEAMELEIKLLGKIGWKHWERTERSRLQDAFPPKYRPF